MPRTFTPPLECPVCGDPVPRGARACPGCGADEFSGWDEETTRYDGLDLPDETFDNDKELKPKLRAAPDRTWIAIGVVLLIALIMTFIFR
jgi:hypothetical protein